MAGTKSIGDAGTEARALRQAEGAVLETPAHHGSGASVPDAFGLGLDELDTGRNRGRLTEQKSVGEMMKVFLIERVETVRWRPRCSYRASWRALSGMVHLR